MAAPNANFPAITGVVGAVTSGVTLANAFLVIFQGVNYDVQDDQNVAFLFNFREEDSVDLSSDITDHFGEGNVALQDEWALRPVKTTLHGYIGELNDQASGIAAEVQLIASQLTVFAPYVPQLTVAALAAYNQAEQIYNTAASAAATLNQLFNLNGLGGQTKQQAAYAFFKSRWQARTLCTVQTPWEILNNMAIEEVHAVQEGESNTVSDFRVTFKQMNFASTITSQASIAQGRRAAQAQAQVPQGFQNGTAVGPIKPGGDNSSVLGT